MKKTTVAVLLFVTMFFCAAAAAEEMAKDVLGADITVREDYTVVVDGIELKSADVPPAEKDGIIFIPLRFAAQALMADVDWIPAEKKVIITRGGLRSVMTVGERRVETPTGEKNLASPPFIFEKRTMIPLQAAAETMFYKVTSDDETMYLEPPDEKALKPYVDAVRETGGLPEGAEENIDYAKIYAIFRSQARKDAVTKTIRPFVIAAWAIAVALWLAKLIAALAGKRDARDLILIGLILLAGGPLVMKIMLSTWWAVIVVCGTCYAGLLSTEDYADKLVTMGSTAMGFGLICTLFGLGLVIGPAIATHNIAAIGYGIYVKIEPTITGLSLSIIMNMLFGYEARKLKKVEA